MFTFTRSSLSARSESKVPTRNSGTLNCAHRNRKEKGVSVVTCVKETESHANMKETAQGSEAAREKKTKQPPPMCGARKFEGGEVEGGWKGGGMFLITRRVSFVCDICVRVCCEYLMRTLSFL